MSKPKVISKERIEDYPSATRVEYDDGCHMILWTDGTFDVYNKASEHHCTWGPSRVYETLEGHRREWCIKGLKHRLDGPAVEIWEHYYSKKKEAVRYEFWLNGNRATELEKARIIIEMSLRVNGLKNAD